MGLLPEQHRDYVRHVTEENMRTNVVASILREAAEGTATWKRALPAIGEQFVLSHESLRDQYGVSSAELDSLVEIACETCHGPGASHAEAESAFAASIACAQRQQLKGFELSATTSLARLWRDSRRDEAAAMLGDVYAWFTEGLDTTDLRAARQLLAELA